MNPLKFIALLLVSSLVIFGCDPEEMEQGDLMNITYQPESYTFDLPAHFPKMEIPTNNPMTNQGILLGRHLFYDPILSADSTMSCASCHLPELNFTDGKAFSKGIDGLNGTRSSMSLINIGFVQAGLFWDGRAKTLEDQALFPVEDPIELHNTWPNVINILKRHVVYPKMFREAFGINDRSEITKELAAKAIAQFERTLVSKDSKFDRIQAGKESYSDLELLGYGLFFDDDPDLPDTECGHCHNIPMTSSDDFFNNGLSEAATLDDFKDLGRGKITGSKSDNGKFRAPTLRNIKYSAPYMHDGRFTTIDDVIAHYKSGAKSSPTKDPLLHKLDIEDHHIQALKAFIDTFTDTLFYKNPEYKNPFK